MSNSGAATAAEIEEVNGKAKMESSAASVAEGTVKRKNNRKRQRMKQEEANASDSRAVEQEATSVAAAGPTLEGAPKLKVKKEVKAKEGEMAEQDAATKVVSASEGMPKLKKEVKAKEGQMAEHEATTKVVSAMEGTSKLKKEVKAKEGEMAEQDATAKVVSASEGMPKLKKKKKKKKEEEEEEAKAKEGEMAEHEATTKVVSALEGMPKLKKKKNEAKAKEGEMAEHEATTKVVSAMEGTPKLKKEVKVKEGEMKEQDATTKVASALEGMPKLKEAKAKEGEMAEHKATTKVVSASEGTPKFKKKKEAKAKEGDMVEHEATTQVFSALEGTPKCKKKKKANGRGMEQHEATTATVSALQGTQKCNKKEKKTKKTGMAEQEAITTTVSGTPKHKKLKKNTMQEQQESPQALSGLVLVDKTVANKPGNSCTNGEGSSTGADVIMDPINGEDPICPEANDANDKLKCETGEGIKNCSENFSSLQESSEDRKTQSRSKKKRKRDASSRDPCISSQDSASVDSSMDHDRSCIRASHLGQARKEKFENISSPKGSLIRFHRKKLLILDLNGLLADINMHYRNAHMANGKVKKKLVFKRPYCDDFLEFCFQNFEVGIWSSRLKDNVDAVINILMPKLKQHLLFCWDMSKCTTTGCNTLEKSFKPLVLKELKKLWNKEDPDLPWDQGEFSPSNTLLVDDSPYKAVCNPPHTAIFPQAYSYLNQRNDYSLGPGGDLRVYLERLAAADDIQVFVQDNPFGQPSITEGDPNWNFYEKIVDKVERGFFPQKKKKWRGFMLKRKRT